MSRLTKYEPNKMSMFPYKAKDEELSTELDIVHKLGMLEDIEEELEIDLITLFKALKNGVYHFVNGQLVKDYVWLVDNHMGVGTYDKLSYSFITTLGRQTLLFDDYGKTWALTKEELENVKEN